MGIAANWSRENIAWAAGIFEGEGWIGASEGKVSLAVSMTDEDVVRKLHHILGVGSVCRETQKLGHKPAWRWAVSNAEAVQAVLAAFWCFLGSRRSERAQQAIVAASKMMRKRGATACMRGHRFEGENLYLTNAGKRMCKTCNSERGKQNYKKRLEANGPGHLRESQNCAPNDSTPG